MGHCPKMVKKSPVKKETIADDKKKNMKKFPGGKELGPKYQNLIEKFKIATRILFDVQWEN